MYRSCMLASLRSLLPKDWDGTHEVAWNWLWDNVERLLKGSLGRPRIWEAALARSLDGMDDGQKFKLRKALYIRFFQTTPQGQEYFKQSDTRLHFIADRIMQMSMELYQDPVKMVDELSGLGLRHVGYAIPPELMNPFVCAFMDELSLKTSDETAIEAARWSLNLICKMLVRTINEGSTLVMKAINANSVKQLRKAISVATRRGRSQSMLNIQVGRHAISPLDWALQSGSLDAARAILEDLLTIRADRERYYYGMEDLFSRHPDIIRRLCKDAPALLPTLLGGLVWRSQQAKEGVRRANYYVKHLVLDSEGGVSKAMEWLCEAKDPKIMIHPVVLKVSSILWNGFVRRLFILSRSWFVMSLIVFMLSQALLPKMPNVQNSRTLRIVVFAGRLLNYTFTMFRLKAQHLGQTFRHLRDRDLTTRLWCFPVPRYLEDFQEIGSLWLLLLLMLMCAHEPMLWCLSSSDVGSDEWPTEFCEESDHVRFRYSLFTAFAMVVHWGMLIDLAVFSTALSAFVLICGQVLSEFSRFLVALTFLIFTFASSISVLEHDYLLMRDIPRSAVALFGITVAIFEDDYRDMSHEPALLCAVLLFVTFTVILLMNLLIAQLNTTYVRIYQDTVGWALINRASTIVEVLSTVSMTKWTRFVEGLGFDEKLEFNEGDVGLPGGVVEAEPASMHPVVHESILRFGGSCKGDEPWPESNEMLEELEEDKLDKLEKVIRRTCRKLGTSRAAVGRRAAAEGA
ncbi:unnamed protein product [Prorocentrum cordatum]|uniref:Globin family profile domain-containing protein n=1 Tax=Prorocentrum cordatum TaxID=2364126 RepID=A0ABN9QPK9_9DINO|nr:unnamed protein product [Polarella glacialis]